MMKNLGFFIKWAPTVRLVFRNPIKHQGSQNTKSSTPLGEPSWRDFSKMQINFVSPKWNDKTVCLKMLLGTSCALKYSATPCDAAFVKESYSADREEGSAAKGQIVTMLSGSAGTCSAFLHSLEMAGTFCCWQKKKQHSKIVWFQENLRPQTCSVCLRPHQVTSHDGKVMVSAWV